MQVNFPYLIPEVSGDESSGHCTDIKLNLSELKFEKFQNEYYSL